MARPLSIEIYSVSSSSTDDLLALRSIRRPQSA